MNEIIALVSNPWLAGPVIFVLLFLESAPVVGFLIPGTLLLPLLGTVTGSESLPFWYVYGCAVAGNLSGDYLGFWLGRTERGEWMKNLRWQRHKNSLEKAQRMLEKRGALAVFLGRFMWLIHPVIPMAAGLFAVGTRTFLVVDSLAVALWIFFYLGAGHVLTSAWFHLF